MPSRPLRFTASFDRPADATAYAAGDEISNNATAGSVVRATFDLQGLRQARIHRLGVSVTPASSNLVITNLDFDVLLFKTPDVPDAVGDNVTHPIPAATRRKAVARFPFQTDAWQNQLGAFSAGTSGFQVVPPVLFLPEPTSVVIPGDAELGFVGSNIDARELTAVVQVLSAWNPGAVVNTFGLTLELTTP